jgi:hypothetical protein
VAEVVVEAGAGESAVTDAGAGLEAVEADAVDAGVAGNDGDCGGDSSAVGAPEIAVLVLDGVTTAVRVGVAAEAACESRGAGTGCAGCVDGEGWERAAPRVSEEDDAEEEGWARACVCDMGCERDTLWACEGIEAMATGSVDADEGRDARDASLTEESSVRKVSGASDVSSGEATDMGGDVTAELWGWGGGDIRSCGRWTAAVGCV